MSLRYLSVCSGIEAASVAWEALGFVPAGFSEIEAFPSEVLAHHYGSNMPGDFAGGLAPDDACPLARNGVPNFGDFTTIDPALVGPVDLLVGGTPCQAFSIAGRRLSLADARGNLTLAYVVLAHGLARTNGLRNAIWENVPGVLNTPDNAFGCFLGALVGGDDALPAPDGGRWPGQGMAAGPRARCAWRILDAQYFGLAQRRKRVFVVVDFGNGADPAAVLFERQGLRGNSPPRRETRQGIAAHAAAGAGTGERRCADVAPTLNAAFAETRGLEAQHIDGGAGWFIFEPSAFKASHFTRDEDGAPDVVTPPLSADADKGDQDTLVLAFSCKDHGADVQENIAPTLRAMGHAASAPNGGGQLAVAFAIQERAVSENLDAGPGGAGVQQDVAYTLEARNKVQSVAGVEGAPRWAVRRLTPVECERLQGFPDGYTAIPRKGRPESECPDGPRYRALGNSMAVPVMRWIGARLLAAMPEARP